MTPGGNNFDIFFLGINTIIYKILDATTDKDNDKIQLM